MAHRPLGTPGHPFPVRNTPVKTVVGRIRGDRKGPAAPPRRINQSFGSITSAVAKVRRDGPNPGVVTRPSNLFAAVAAKVRG